MARVRRNFFGITAGGHPNEYWDGEKQASQEIVAARRFASLNMETLRQLGVVLKRAKYFLTCQGEHQPRIGELSEQQVRRQILFGGSSVRSALVTQQLDLFAQAN